MTPQARAVDMEVELPRTTSGLQLLCGDDAPAAAGGNPVSLVSHASLFDENDMAIIEVFMSDVEFAVLHLDMS